MLDAHMDEVGFIITSVQSDGAMTFSEVGGIDPTVVIGRQVTVGSKGLIGVVGAKAVHNLSAEERDKTPEMDSLYIDIGAADKKRLKICGSRRLCVFCFRICGIRRRHNKI